MKRDRNKEHFSPLILLRRLLKKSIIVTIYNSNELNTEQETLNASENKIQLIKTIVGRIRSCKAADYVAGTYWQT